MYCKKYCSKKFLSIWLLVMSLLSVTTSVLANDTVNRLPKIRVGSASNKFDHTHQVAAVFDQSAPTFFRAHHLEVAIGSISTTQHSEAFISIGPVWRLRSWKKNAFLDFGFSPTYLSQSTFNGRDAGGNIHFTSSLSIGLKLGRNQSGSISLRVQHMSNGGLSSTNPGMDIIGLEFSLGEFQ